MTHPLVRKLEYFAPLSEADKEAIVRVTANRLNSVAPRTEIIAEGSKPRFVKIIVEGWCCRHKMLENGRRQILAFMLPGDLCDFNVTVLRHMDHSISSITDVTYALLTQETMDDLTGGSPALMRALWWESLTRESIQREWTLNLGQRTAYERVAHLMCELFVRQQAIGLADGDSVPFPITQGELSDATGMSNVHVNRTLQELRADGLIVFRGGRLTVPNMESLARAAMFSPAYLHLDRGDASAATG